MDIPDISIIIPAYNEESRLPSYLASVLDYLERSKLCYEVIVVDDGSTDSTAEIVEQVSIASQKLVLIRLDRNMGKGYAVKTGMLYAHGARRLFADADGATSISELDRLMKAMDAGFDVVIASRAGKNSDCKVNYKIHRKLMGAIYNRLVRIVLGLNSCDTQCGFKLMSSESAKNIFLLQRLGGFGFDVEMLFIARKLGFSSVEVAINWSDVKGSKVSVIKDSVYMFLDIIKVKYYDLKGCYGLPSSV